MKHALYLTGAILALSSYANSALAQSNPSQTESEFDSREIISVGQRIGTAKQTEITSPVSLLTETDIINRGQGYVSDLLRALPGVSVSRSGPSGNLTQIRVRGSEANHVLVLIDGIEAGNPNTGEFDFAGLRSEDIVRVELLRGEQSALYGSDALGGVISITTRAARAEAGYDVSYEMGSFKTRAVNGTAVYALGDKLGERASLSLNGTYFETDGYDISTGGSDELDGSESRNLNIGLNNVELGPFTINAKGALSTLETEFDSDSNFDGRLNDTNDELTTDTALGRVAVNFNLLDIDNTVSFAITNTDAENPNAGFRNDTQGTRRQFSWIAKKSWGAHNLTLLGESETEKFTNFGGVDAGQNQTESLSNQAIAADYRFTPGAMTLTASARQDFNSRFDNALTYRVGGSYHLEAIGGRLRGSYGTGIKNPTLTELFGFFPAFFVGNPDLKPEESQGFNIGYEQTFGDAINFSVDYFKSDLENEIFTDFSAFPSTAKNRTSQSQRDGVELEARWRVSDMLNFNGSATFLNSEEDGVKEIRRPDFTASGSVTVRATDRLSLTGVVDHTGSQTDQDFATFPARVVTLDAFTLVGLNASYDVAEGVTVSLRGENLLDEKYEEVIGYASQNRAIYGQLRARF